jgi:bile acid:Na+ symporter, BASS family
MPVSELFKISIVALVFGLGLRALPHDVLHIWKRPPGLVRGLVPIYLLVPLLAAAIAFGAALPMYVGIAMLLIAVSPVLPLTSSRQLRLGGDADLVFSLSVGTVLLGIVSIPLSLSILSPLMVSDATVERGAVARLVGVLFLLPLFVGSTLHALAGRGLERLSRASLFLGHALVVAAVLHVLARRLPELLALSVSVLPALTCLSVGALAIGHLLGGPHEEDRRALAVACATRHPGFALLIATANFTNETVLPVIVEYLLVSAVVTVPYTMWSRRRTRSVELAAARVGVVSDSIR